MSWSWRMSRATSFPRFVSVRLSHACSGKSLNNCNSQERFTCLIVLSFLVFYSVTISLVKVMCIDWKRSISANYCNLPYSWKRNHVKKNSHNQLPACSWKLLPCSLSIECPSLMCSANTQVTPIGGYLYRRI
jgi:hypothetical protein